MMNQYRRCLIALIDNSISGSIYVQVVECEKKSISKFSAVSVSKQYEKQGIGSSLVNEAEQLVLNSNISKMEKDLNSISQIN